MIESINRIKITKENRDWRCIFCNEIQGKEMIQREIKKGNQSNNPIKTLLDRSQNFQAERFSRQFLSKGDTTVNYTKSRKIEKILKPGDNPLYGFTEQTMESDVKYQTMETPMILNSIEDIITSSNNCPYP